MKVDLIEIHIVFDRPKSVEHMRRIGDALVRVLRRDLYEHFPKQVPDVYLADVRDER